MKIIEAMKRVKANKLKVQELQKMINLYHANLSHETPVYGTETSQKITEWLQSCTDLSQENIRLLCAIQKTNIATDVAIELDGKIVTKKIAEWIWRKREYATIDLQTWNQLNDKGLKEVQYLNNSTGGAPTEIKIVRQYQPEKRDKMRIMYQQEPKLIDAALEVVNAGTDLIE